MTGRGYVIRELKTADATLAAALWPAIARSAGRLRVPPPLAADMLALVLGEPLPASPSASAYREALQEIAYHPHLRAVRHRLRRLERQNPGGNADITDVRNGLIVELTVRLAGNLTAYLPPERADGPPLSPHMAPHIMMDRLREDADQAGCGRRLGNLLFDDYLMALVELAAAAHAGEWRRDNLNEPLLRRCLDLSWQMQRHVPRPLVTRYIQGSRRQQLRGEDIAVRAISVKWREEQLKDVLASEWAAVHVGTEGRDHVLYKMVNGKPLIVERELPHDEIVRQRVLISFALGGDPHQQTTHLAASPHVALRAAAYSLLVMAALAFREQPVVADVAWFERRGKTWLGALLPLADFEPTDQSGSQWRNVARMQELMPFFLVHFAAGLRSTHGLEVEAITEPPQVFLPMVADRHTYQHIFQVVFMVNDERELLTTDLPRNRHDIRSVLLADFAADGLGRQRPGEGCRAQFVSRTTDARYTGAAMAEWSLDQLAAAFLEMVLGPVADTATGASPEQRSSDALSQV